MLVTQLIPRGKTKTVVELDYEETLLLSNKEILLYGLREGEEVPEAVYEELRQSLRKAAERKCVSLLERMDYTESRLAECLLHAGYPEEIVRDAVGAMREAGLTDDRRYARNYLEYHITEHSRLRMKADLKSRGVPDSILEEVFAEWELENAEQIEQSEMQQIRNLMRKREYDPAAADREQSAKMISFLQGRGYSYELIRKTFRTQ